MTTKHLKQSTPWHVGLWIAQVLLAGLFLAIGLMKAATPIAELSKTVPLAGEMPALVRFIGISEIAGGLGVLLPAALRIWPRLTVIAASALALVMVLALLYHLLRGEFSAIGVNIVLGGLGVLIAWGRVNRAPITARTARVHVTANDVN